MKTNNKVKLIAISLSLILGSAGVNAQPMPHIAQPGENWILQTKRSNEFDIKDAEKWNFKQKTMVFGLGKMKMPVFLKAY
ncbi:hypothetical protein [Pseudoalteromonas sp. S3178]|uniref:hypothetical protein n=1 Tax=Pseudoalteromonas sp. S3178 TaxID=579532 RepID=UPI00110B46D2|nr:hypothetical protein [Pseudoalteromonas sp. S3178]